jgi:hypothetical protein
MARPIGNYEEVYIGNRKVFTHQVFVLAKVPIQMGKARHETPPEYFFSFLWHAFVEEWRKSTLMHLA